MTIILGINKVHNEDINTTGGLMKYICQNTDSRNTECIKCRYCTPFDEFDPMWQYMCIRFIVKEKKHEHNL